MLAGFAETDRLQVLAPRRQHVGRVSAVLAAVFGVDVQSLEIIDALSCQSKSLMQARAKKKVQAKSRASGM
jgi:hypothetical protein